MNRKTKTYIGVTLVFIASVALATLMPMAFKGIASMPAIGALIGALYQLLRDQAEFEKRVLLKQKEQIFSLGVTSHMANVAFDNHVDFCEEYLFEVHSTTTTLFREGPTEQALSHVIKFGEIRKKYAAWITKDISSQLDGFEVALNQLGAKSRLVSSTTGSPRHAETRSKAIDEAEKVWGSILGQLIDKKAEVDENIAVESVKEKVRSILGIEELLKVRQWIINRAVQGIKD